MWNRERFHTELYGCGYACIRFAKWACDRLTEDADFGKKKIIFSEAHFDLGGYVNKQNCRIWPKTSHCLVRIWKWARGGRCIQWRSLSRHVERIFVHKNLRSFNTTALRATQPKLHSIFCALFLKIALSAAELMSFGHLGAAIWHRWTIICGVPSKISVTPPSQRQLTL